jgi:hypothetical protein
MSIIRKEQLTNPLTASYAFTASYAENANTSTTNTSSLLVTASVSSNVITFTKGNTDQFSITVNTGSSSTINTSSLVTTSSFNAFTASINIFTSSYNTGSFSGSFTGNFNGTASWAYSASQALTASYVNPLHQDVIITGSIYLTTSSIYFSGSSAASRLIWNNTDGTLDLGLKGGNVTLQIGQESVIQVINKTGANLLESEYKAVRIRRVDEGGAQGQRLAIVLAQADSDANSVDTLGLVTENININQEGFITNSGLVRNINTTGTLQGETWVDGDALYLSPTVPGKITKVKPQAPQHTVVMGYVVYAHQNQGKIFVKVDNGYEIDELHNVRITTASLTTGDLLAYSSSVWVNTKQLTGSYGLTGSLTAISFTGSLLGTAATASYYQETDPIFVAKSASLATTGSNNFNGNQTITGSLSQGLEGNIASGPGSHAEGSATSASGEYSHAEGDFTQATGNYSHAEGQNSMTLASAQYSHAEGNNTIAAANHQHVQGQWNVTSSIPAAFIVGNGTDNSNRSNLIYAHDSTVEITGSLSTTEFFTTTINETSLENFSSTSNYAGTVINTIAIDGDVQVYDLVYLDTDGVWYQNNQATAASSLKLGIYLGNDLILTEGHIVIDDPGALGPNVQTPRLGVPIFIRENAGAYMSTLPPITGYVRILGHIYYQNQNTNSNLYIMRFNPSNDFYLLG